MVYGVYGNHLKYTTLFQDRITQHRINFVSLFMLGHGVMITRFGTVTSQLGIQIMISL
jgi:hypothetical protein